MTRSLSAGVLAEIATNKLNPVELIYLGVSTGSYYTDHYKDLTFDGNTYTASSLFLGSSSFTLIHSLCSWYILLARSVSSSIQPILSL